MSRGAFGIFFLLRSLSVKPTPCFSFLGAIFCELCSRRVETYTPMCVEVRFLCFVVQESMYEM